MRNSCVLFALGFFLSLPLVRADDAKDLELARQLAQDLLKQFDQQEIVYQVNITWAQAEYTVSQKGEASIARTDSRHSVSQNFDVSEAHPGQEPSIYRQSKRTIIEKLGPYISIDYEQTAKVHSPATIVQVIKSDHPFEQVQLCRNQYAQIGLGWLVGMGWLEVGAPELIAMDEKLKPAKFTLDRKKHEFTYQALCGEVVVTYELNNNKPRLKSLAVIQKRDDILTVNPSRPRLKLGECQRGPGFKEMKKGLDSVNLLLELTYNPDGNISLINYSELSCAGKMTASKTAELRETSRKPITDKDIGKKYLGSIPNGTPAYIVNDRQPYVLQDGVFVKAPAK